MRARMLMVSLVTASVLLLSGRAGAQMATAAPSPDSPVVRFGKGDMGMTFLFGGLAPMSVAGMVTQTVGRALFTEVGVRKALSDDWMLPVSFGVGMLNNRPAGTDTSFTDFGLSFTVGIQHYFSKWRRIAPFVGAKLHLHYLDPTGPTNYLIQTAVGPTLGIEYFVADMVSLTMESTLFIGINYLAVPTESKTVQVGIQSLISFGGLMGLTFYFR